jgi:hypothetical protein
MPPWVRWTWRPTKVFFGEGERRASDAVAQLGISQTGRKHDACPSHSHRFTIGPDSTRFGAKCANNPAATDQSKFRGWDYWTAGKQERTYREVS